MSTEEMQARSDPETKLAKLLGRGKGTRWMRIAVQCVAGAISAASGGFVSLMTGAFAGGMSGAAGSWSESEQEGVNALVQECLRVQRDQIEDVTSNVMQILMRLDLNDDATARRVESPEYQNLLRRAFRQWTFVESEEKREHIRRLLTHAGDPRVQQDDFIRLFIDWIGRYSELHFRVMKIVFQNEGFTRADIWEAIHGQEVREDSKEADIFKCLISDLSTGHVIWRCGGEARMKTQANNAIRRVFKEAAEHGRFFDLCDAERLAWMIEHAFVLGTLSVGTPLRRSPTGLGVVHKHHASARKVRGQERRKS